eukprot:s6290_g4.t1
MVMRRCVSCSSNAGQTFMPKKVQATPPWLCPAFMATPLWRAAFSKEDADGRNALYYVLGSSCEDVRIKVLAKLLDMKCSPVQADACGRSALNYALWGNEPPAVVKALMQTADWGKARRLQAAEPTRAGSEEARTAIRQFLALRDVEWGVD